MAGNELMSQKANSQLILNFRIFKSLAGDVRFMDPRNPTSAYTVQTSQGMTAMAVHPKAHLFAWYLFYLFF